MSDGYSPLLPFETESVDFAHGFECGRVWQQLRENPDGEITATMHWANAEMILRLAEATGRTVECDDLDAEWIEAKFSATDTA